MDVTKDLRQRLKSFGTRCLQRILGYCCSDFVSNEQLLRETKMIFVTCKSMSISRGCMDMCLDFLTLILLSIFFQRGSFLNGEGERDNCMPRGCNRLIDI